MKYLVDSNVWVALAVSKHLHHPIAAKWFDQLALDDRAFICRQVEISFLRLITSKIAPDYTPVTNREAIEICQELLADNVVERITEPINLEKH